MDPSMIVLSLNYLIYHDTAIHLSKWLYNELSAIYYNEDKLSDALYRFDLDIAESIIHLNEDKSLLDRFLFYYVTSEDKKRILMIELIVKNGAIVTPEIFAIACEYNDY